MIIWEIITNIFWALLVTIVLWVLCAFVGKLVYLNYRMKPLQHLICFMIAIPTAILLFVFFTSGRVNRVIKQADTNIVRQLMADDFFLEKISRTDDTDDLADFVAEKFSDRIASEHTMLRRHVNASQILENAEIREQISNLSQGGNEQQIVQVVADGFTRNIRARIRAIRRNMLLFVVLLQTIPFGMVIYQANKRDNQPLIYTCNGASSDYL